MKYHPCTCVGQPNVFDTADASGVLKSVFEDYCPDHGVCNYFKKGADYRCIDSQAQA